MIAINEKQFQNLVYEGNAPVLVEFWAPWCVYCRRIVPALNRVSEEFEGRLTVAQVNIDEEPALASREHIEVIPTLVLYQGGEVLGSIVAPESKARIVEFIHETLGEGVI